MYRYIVEKRETGREMFALDLRTLMSSYLQRVKSVSERERIKCFICLVIEKGDDEERREAYALVKGH